MHFCILTYLVLEYVLKLDHDLQFNKWNAADFPGSFDGREWTDWLKMK